MDYLEDTLEFIRAWQDPGAGPVLDVGAGAGELVAALATRGFRARGLDPDPDAVEEARRRGRTVRESGWPAPVERRYGALLFVRSLHHMDDLEAAVAGARDALDEGGLILVEDFAFADLPEGVLPWLAPWIEAAASEGLLAEERHRVVTHLLEAPGGPSLEPHHLLHPAERMEEAIRRHFQLLEAGSAPYLYRYLAASMGESEEGRRLLARVVAAEREAIEGGELWPLGRRWVGRA